VTATFFGSAVFERPPAGHSLTHVVPSYASTRNPRNRSATGDSLRGILFSTNGRSACSRCSSRVVPSAPILGKYRILTISAGGWPLSPSGSWKAVKVSVAAGIPES